MVPLALVVAVGGGATAVALATADRTAGAFDEYLRDARSGDVVINPFFGSREIEQVIRDLPGVEQVTNAPVYMTTFGDTGPRPRGEVALNESTTGTDAVGSPDGRYLDMDRPIVREGRMATGPNEAVLSAEAAAAEGLGVGDTLTLSFWTPGVELLDFVADPAERERLSAEVVEPVGVEELEIVGIVTLPDEVIPDDLYPRQRIVLSPDVARRYLCQPDGLPTATTATELIAELFPDDCASSYHFYSVRLADGSPGVGRTLGTYLREANLRNERAGGPVEGSSLAPPEYLLVATETAQIRDRVATATRPSVAALRVLGAAAAVVTVALATFAASRELRRSFAVQRRWAELGLESDARAGVLLAPLVLATVLGAVVALVAALVVRLGPIGLLGVLPGGGAPSARSVGSVLAIAVVVTALTAWLALRSVRRAELAPRARHPGRRTAGGAPPPLTVGVRAALGSRTTPPVVAGGAVLVTALVAAFVFGASLSSLLASPRAYGWPWDVGVVAGFGYGNLDVERAERIGQDPAVEGITVLALVNEVTVDGEPMMGLIGFDRIADVDVPLLEGELPARADEVALGATVADRLGVEVGDTVTLGGALDDVTATVSGIVVFPTLGPFMSDRVETGTGVYFSQAAFGDGADAVLGGSVDDIATFLGLRLRDGVRDVPAAVARALPELDRTGGPVFEYRDPVRPAPIVDARSTRTIPVVVGVVFGAALVVGVAFATLASIRARRRELAVLRALGFTSRQLRRSVLTESLTTAALALVVGVPLGVLAGRFLWRAFAEDLGVVPDPAAAWLPVLATVGLGLVLAALAALVPAARAARAAPAPALRAE